MGNANEGESNAREFPAQEAYLNSDGKNAVNKRTYIISEQFDCISKVNQALIAKITSKFGEIMVENFFSLVFIFSEYEKLKYDVMLKESRESQQRDTFSSEWLIAYSKQIYSIQKRLRTYRGSVVHNLEQRTASNDIQMKKLIDSIQNISLNAQSSIGGLLDRITTVDMSQDKISLGKALEELSRYLKFGEIPLASRRDAATPINRHGQLQVPSSRSTLSKSKNSSNKPIEYSEKRSLFGFEQSFRAKTTPEEIFEYDENGPSDKMKMLTKNHKTIKKDADNIFFDFRHQEDEDEISLEDIKKVNIADGNISPSNPLICVRKRGFVNPQLNLRFQENIVVAQLRSRRNQYFQKTNY